MRKYTIDSIWRVRLEHVPGRLAKLATVIAEEGGLLGEISTERIGERDTVRQLTIESADEDHLERLLAAVRALEGVEILEVIDRVFQRHQGGKIRMTPTLSLDGVRDLRDIYTPGVARVATAIADDPERAWDLTALGNTVGIFTNGTRVLGLGDLGPLGALPVMEGKAVLYASLAGLSAVPLVIDERDPDKFIETVMRLSPGFGGIHLEDIRVPDCFHIERTLIERLDKPVMHDDQHGTAVAALAGVINACEYIGKDPRRQVVGQIGLGAAGSAIARLAHLYGVADVLVTDPHQGAVETAVAWGAKASTLEEILGTCDVVIATTGQAGLIKPSQVRKGVVMFALSNPEPEIRPLEAREAGAAFAGDGRSVNNALAFPGIFRGALEARARRITPEMLLAAVDAIAGIPEPRELVASPLDPRVHLAVAKAVADTARAQKLDGTARTSPALVRPLRAG